MPSATRLYREDSTKSPLFKAGSIAPANPSNSNPSGGSARLPDEASLRASSDRTFASARFPTPTTCKSKVEEPSPGPPAASRPVRNSRRSPANSCSMLAMTVSNVPPTGHAAVKPDLWAAPDLISVTQSLGVETAWNIVADSNPQCIMQFAHRGSLPTPYRSQSCSS